MEVWHFVGDKLRDGRAVPADGVLLEHKGPVVPCVQGLHGVVCLIDGLRHAKGDTICRCLLDGDLTGHTDLTDNWVEGGLFDKWVGRYRVILWRIDGTNLLRQFAREMALSVTHLWKPPDLVLQYLKTGDESLKGKACIRAMARASARARDASRYAARAAALASSDKAPNAMAESSCRASVWSAAENTARSSDWASDWARDASRDKAWDAAWGKANDLLTEMVLNEHEHAIK